MVEYITWLKALAALLITNSHMGHIYPVESLATGGLLGNLLFFAVSGFCLYNIRQPFLRWYARRLVRIYPAVWGVTALAVLTGVYSLSSWQRGVQLFLYPTYYHFIAAILLLYVPFYFVARVANGRKQPVRFLLGCAGLLVASYAGCYTCLFDSSYYHIDTVEEPMILFVYAAAMLMGALFRVNNGRVSYRLPSFFLLGIAGIFYAYTKLTVSSGAIPFAYQFINQISILLLLYSLFMVAASWKRLYSIDGNTPPLGGAYISNSVFSAQIRRVGSSADAGDLPYPVSYFQDSRNSRIAFPLKPVVDPGLYNRGSMGCPCAY